MPIEVACPNCQVKLKAPDGMAGKKARCKKCATSFRIPGADEPVGAESTMMLSAVESLPADIPAAKASPKAPATPKAAEPIPKAAAPAPAPKKVATNTPSPDAPAAKKSEPAPLPVDDGESEAPVQEPSFEFGVTADSSNKSASPAAPPPKKEKTPAAKAKTAATRKAVPDPEVEDLAFVTQLENPFSLANLADPSSPATVGDKLKGDEKDSKASADEKNADGKPTRAYRGPNRGSNKILFLALGLGLFAVMGGIGAVVVMKMNKQKEREAEAQKKEAEAKALQAANAPPETPAPTPPPTPAPIPTPTPPVNKGPEIKPPTPMPMPTTPTPKAKGPAPPVPGALVLPATARPIAFSPLQPKSPALVMGTQPNTRGSIDTPITAVRRLFPPEADDERFAVLWVSAEGTLGKGEKLTLDRFFQGERQGRVEDLDSDGKPPICDLSQDANQFAHVADGKITVYNVNDKEKLSPTWEPYGKPEYAALRAGGVVALYFAADPTMLVTVASTGHVHLWEVKTARLLGEFAPTTPAPVPLTPGAVTVGDRRSAVIVAIGGALHYVSFPKMLPPAGPDPAKSPLAKLTVAVRDLGGPVRVLAMGQQEGSDNRLLVAIETLGEKKEKAILRYKDGQKDPDAVRWPDDLGTPTSAGWASTFVVAVATDNGSAILFNDEQRFASVARISPEGKAFQVPTRGEGKHWIAMADPADAKRTILAGCEMPFDGFDTLTQAKSPLPTLKVAPK